MTIKKTKKKTKNYRKKHLKTKKQIYGGTIDFAKVHPASVNLQKAK
jgi:hypothetical protein